MPERIRLTKVMDARTGEVIQETSETFHASDWFMPGKGYKLYGRNKTKLGKLGGMAGLTMIERGVLLTLIGAANRDNKLPGLDKMVELTGSKPRQVYRWLNRLQLAGIVAKGDGSWYLNPAIAFAGVYLSPYLYRIFTASLEGIIPKWARSAYDNEGDTQT